MITHLYIKNLAIIREAQISFSKGFVAITGETGAGKSILLDAINLILGHRSELNLVGAFSEKCVVEAHFKTDQNIHDFLVEHEYDLGDELILRREVRSNGKSRCFINDTPVTLSEIKAISSHLMYIHSQFSNVNLKTKKFQFNILDSYAGINDKRQIYLQRFNALKAFKTDLIALRLEFDKIHKSKDYNDFLLQEIENLQLNRINYDELEDKLNKAESHELITNAINSLKSLDHDNSVVDALRKIKVEISKIAKSVDSFKSFESQLDSLLDQFNQVVKEAHSYDLQEPLSIDEKRLLLEQIDNFNRVLNKHRLAGVPELIEYKRSLENNESDIQALSDRIELLEKRIKQQETELNDLAALLHEKRIKSTPLLIEALKMNLQQLNMSYLDLSFNLKESQSIDENGITEIDLQVSFNKGVPKKSMESVASGGELSRFMLGIHGVLTPKLQLPTIVFDEIDSGVGGETASKMAQFLNNMALDRQIIAITHLPQIAAHAQQHLLVQKSEELEQSKTKIHVLNGEDRAIEIAKMMSGTSVNINTLEIAKNLISKGK